MNVKGSFIVKCTCVKSAIRSWLWNNILKRTVSASIGHWCSPLGEPARTRPPSAP